MKYKITLEFDTPQELADFMKANDVPQEETVIVRDIQSVARHTRREGKQFTKWEDDYMIDHFITHTARQIAASLGRTPSSIGQRFNQLRKDGKVGKKRNVNGKVRITDTRPCKHNDVRNAACEDCGMTFN